MLGFAMHLVKRGVIVPLVTSIPLLSCIISKCCMCIVQKSWANETVRKSQVIRAVVDTLVWQGLASVAVPGFTINRICFLSNIILRHTTSLPAATRKWTVTAIGLSAIPFIIHSIDHGVHFVLDNTLRKWTAINSDETAEHRSARDL